MESPIQITCRGFSHHAELDELIRARVLELERHAGHALTSCHVVVELGHEHVSGPRLFHVKIDAKAAGDVIIVNRDKHEPHTHEDAAVAVRKAFDAAEKEIEHHHRKHRH